jgi:DNA-binding transcriptional MerR regulator
MDYTSRHAVILYKVTAETIRSWTEEFSQYLSATANPGKGRHRVFTDEDMQVFAYIHERKGQGAVFEQIHAELMNGNRGNIPALPPEEVQALVSDQQEKRLALQVENLQLVLERQKQQMDTALARAAEADELKTKYIQIQTELDIIKRTDNARIEELTEELSRARQQLMDLSQQIGQSYAKGVLDTLERQGNLRKQDAPNDRAGQG